MFHPKKLIFIGFLIFFYNATIKVDYVLGIENDSVTQPSYHNDFQSIFKKAKISYGQTNFLESIRLGKKAYNIAVTKNDIFDQVKVLNFLSLANQKIGKWQEAKSSVNLSIQLLASQPNSHEDYVFLLGQAFNVKGNLEFSMGEVEESLISWQKAQKQAEKIDDLEGIQGSLVNQVTAYSALGEYLQANKVLNILSDKIEKQPDSKIKTYALLSLGNTLQQQGDLKQSELVLRETLKIAKNTLEAHEVSKIWFSLANTFRDLYKVDEALIYYQKIIETVGPKEIKIKARLNKLAIMIEQEDWQLVNNLKATLKTEISFLPPSRTNIYSQVNFVQSLMQLSRKTGENYNQEIIKILKIALDQARKLEDNRSQSYVYGILGKLYLQKGQIKEAEQLTQTALILAETINANDVVVQWQAQMGKIYQQQGKNKQAVSFYQSAVNNLESLSQDLYSNNRELQFSFRENVEPIYRQLIDLLLAERQPSEGNIKQSIKVFEQLHIAELKNFFGDGCLVSKSVEDIDDRETAIIYPIILPNRLAIITSLPGKQFEYASREISQSQLESMIIQARNSLHPIASNQKREQLTQQIYDWLIRPLEAELKNHQIKTLVFVLDGTMRNLPMASLSDGQNYLIEKYAIALIPVRVDLLDPRPWQSKQLEVLVGGLSESRQGFSSLPAVELEIKEISAQSQAKILLNDDFTEENLAELIKQTPFPVVHLATHGQFSSREEDTFLLAWNGTINIKELEALIKTRKTTEGIELLILSACQTASGDQRAALGLAGLAMRSGARSVVATLWSVNDQSTAELMVNFYQELQKPGISKSEALRQAQLQLLRSSKYNHPYYWTPFVVIGNWL